MIRIGVVVGPTASGKTELALALAERLGAEVVSADSQQVYRGFDLGTAKPAPAQQAQIRHHLVSCVDPAAVRMDAARYAREADAAIAGIAGRGRRALVVGGTGLYVRALMFGLVPGPGRNAALRAALERRAVEEGRASLHAELARRDPAAAAKVEPADLVRIVRALEILEVSGRPASELRGDHRFAQPRYLARGFLLSPPRAELYRRIDVRTRAMFQGGLVDEVRALVGCGLVDAPPMKSIGYAQALAVVQGKLGLEEAIADAAQATRRYAKRQLTWFRREGWLEVVEQRDAERIARELERSFIE